MATLEEIALKHQPNQNPQGLYGMRHVLAALSELQAQEAELRERMEAAYSAFAAIKMDEPGASHGQ